METLRQQSDRYEILGLAGADAHAGKAFAGIPRFTTTELLAIPALEAVTVETDFAEACRAAQQAVDAGKHVHLDKPGALQHEEFRKLRTSAEQRGLVFQMGYMLRYNPAFQLLKRIVEEAWLGEITEVDAMMGKRLDAQGRKALAVLPGGGMFELACHLLDQVVWLLGKPQRVTAFTKLVGTDGFKDNQLAVLEYPKAIATIRCNMIDPFGAPRRRFSITGTKGSMEISPLESGKLILRLQEAKGNYQAGEQSIQLPVEQGRYDGEFRAFAAAIRDAQPLPWTAAHDIAVHETVLRAAGVEPL
jgi:predicted dehydrogenase